MSKKLIATISLVVAMATPGVAMSANNATPSSPGACNMVNASGQGLSGMMNDPHVWDIMIPLVLASENAGCAQVNPRP